MIRWAHPRLLASSYIIIFLNFNHFLSSKFPSIHTFIFQFSGSSSLKNEKEQPNKELALANQDQETQVSLVVPIPDRERALHREIGQAQRLLASLKAEIDGLIGQRDEFVQLLDGTR